ncbi:hypothetical protein LX64_00791 [Chitinophaga skermanii]|uniref:Uncharacterized protein n=1 Tax=Chitinophaga skermanii TaxID=331697 RepID=A0A327R6H2_9BACT|nr:hypothetical protein LX64_00791 [Chitinophaga skermanii]
MNNITYTMIIMGICYLGKIKMYTVAIWDIDIWGPSCSSTSNSKLSKKPIYNYITFVVAVNYYSKGKTCYSND